MSEPLRIPGKALALLPMLLICLGLHHGAARAASAEAGDLDPEMENLFRWGEYDSLIRMLEPTIEGDDDAAGPAAGPRTRADSARWAKASLYLGVAYWASGRLDDVEAAFARACRLDADLRLDPLYATGEMTARFDSISAAECSRKRFTGRDIRDPVEPGREAEPSARSRRIGGRKWIYWTAGIVAATGVAAGGIYYLATRDPKTEETVIPIEPYPPYPP